ncbi:molybdopterin-binding protein [Paenibacillus radicis (ex Xue et al. 2023)]|uniref:Molybdopterin molybdenumtransferase n=1 Tax=Paenibacillus radicis (ex Xue et al. 2023) TaxID=2972489 RepID=A0ABT1YS03_9BACL|nr:molybdopterin-binding protein [Paenibacillus radicis (ex Xue et al. 2023)]MCR8635958.1 molybdopterin-binding protein [Paenibacillus radicis (ex Xue et al. 2023)]
MKKLDSMLREVKVEEAIGKVLAHDLTQIIPGAFKGRLFTKGHVITEQDIPALLSIGKEHIYVIAMEEGWLHEDEAAIRLARAAVGANVSLTEPHEGKVSLKSTIHGLVKINKSLVDAANSIDQVVMSTLKSNTVVKQGQVLTGTRVIPLLVEEEKVRQVEQLAVTPLVEVKPFRPLRVGLITTGSEVYKGRIQDKFGPVVRDKVAALGSEIIEQRLTPDESDTIVNEIRYFLEERKVDLILVTGGMSVDPDDRTPGAIKQAGARIVSYGTPMLPGSMLLMGYLGDSEVPIMGLPGCVMHDPYTSFDVLLPRICAGEVIVREDITELGYGGLYYC